MIHNTVCSLLLREGEIYREIAVVNMWWMNIIVVALLALGIFGFVMLVRLVTQRLTGETIRRAEDMYDEYADSPHKRHRRSLASRRYCPVLPKFSSELGLQLVNLADVLSELGVGGALADAA